MNAYQVLGVTQQATEAELKRAYRDLCLECHPDRNPGDPVAEERFKEVSQAYHLLSDPGRRREYDLGGIFTNGPSGDVHADIRQTVEGFVTMFNDFFEHSPLFEETRQKVEEDARQAAASMSERDRVRAQREVRKAAKGAARNRQGPKVKAVKCTRCRDLRYREIVQGTARIKVPCLYC